MRGLYNKFRNLDNLLKYIIIFIGLYSVVGLVTYIGNITGEIQLTLESESMGISGETVLSAIIAPVVIFYSCLMVALPAIISFGLYGAYANYFSEKQILYRITPIDNKTYMKKIFKVGFVTIAIYLMVTTIIVSSIKGYNSTQIIEFLLQKFSVIEVFLIGAISVICIDLFCRGRKILGLPRIILIVISYLTSSTVSVLLIKINHNVFIAVGILVIVIQIIFTLKEINVIRIN